MNNKKYILPAEWYPQCGILLAWPHEATDWNAYLQDAENTYVELVRAISSHEKVLIIAPKTENIKELLTGKLSYMQQRNVDFAVCDTNDTWIRDFGPITLIDDDGDAVMMDFGFNGWGNKYAANKDNLVTANLHRNGVLMGEVQIQHNFILEGGSIECDGKGTIFTTTCCLLSPNRNEPMTQEQIEDRLKKKLYADRVIWLEHGKLVGDDTDGHVDTIVRTAPENTLLYVGCDDEGDEQYADFQALERQLKSLRTLEGEPYRLLKLPMPYAIYENDDRLPATYANFLVINGAVICPVYGQEDNDQKALEVIGKAFPDREIIAVDARTLIRQHGSIHCVTMQMPPMTF